MCNLDNEIKQANILLHRYEAKIYDSIHKEIFNPIEQKMIMYRLLDTTKNISTRFCLDMGCGTGNLTLKESNIFSNVIGLDSSKEMIQILKNKITKNNRIELIIADCENVPFINNCFNFISMFSVLHHLPNYVIGFKESFRVLKNNGLLFIDHEPNEIGIIRDMKRHVYKILSQFNYRDTFNSLDYSKADIHAKKGFNRKFIKKILLNIGFINVKISFHYLLLYINFELLHKIYIKFWEFLDKFLITKKFADCLTIIALKREN